MIMPLYFFHLRNHDERLLDPAGKMIDRTEEIPAVTLREARAIIAHDALSGIIDFDQRIEVEDKARNLVHVLRFADAVSVTGASGG
jgi:hypothetical protein